VEARNRQSFPFLAMISLNCVPALSPTLTENKSMLISECRFCSEILKKLFTGVKNRVLTGFSQTLESLLTACQEKSGVLEMEMPAVVATRCFLPVPQPTR